MYKNNEQSDFPNQILRKVFKYRGNWIELLLHVYIS
jgi:hypothetical protein